MDNESAIELLNHLRERIFFFQELPEPDDRFYEWHTEVLKALVSIFGSESTEIKEFQQIRFQLDPNASGSFRERTRDLLENAAATVSFDDSDSSQVLYYRQRLHEASELLLAFIIGLRRVP